MRLQATRALTIAMAISAMGCNLDGGNEPRVPPAAVPAWSADAVRAWREKHEADYTREYASIAGLHPLKNGINTAGSAAGHDVVLPASAPARLGRFVLAGTTVRFEPAPGVVVSLESTRPDAPVSEQPVTGPVALKDDGTPGMDELVLGSVRLVVHVSGESRGIRVRDPNGPLAKGFLGFTWFDIDPAFRVVGRFVPDAEPRKLKVMNTYGDVDEYTTEGVVEFTWDGQPVRLRPFTTRPKRLYFVFRDASSGKETYEAARFLYADLGDDGSVALDFNMAYNPPCAFNPYTTCPIPLAENRLAVKILAGEKAYPAKVVLPETGR
ncbi:MAG: DUF1684 domain-containing protein [Acidobacteria bacterium]|nr:DUF1684 domain-containing protein [Acidobacteriota bacterium]